MDTPSYDVIVIGAGPAGLTAAYELMKRDVPITVLEKDPSYALAYSGLADCYSLLATFAILPSKEALARAKAAAAAQYLTAGKQLNLTIPRAARITNAGTHITM